MIGQVWNTAIVEAPTSEPIVCPPMVVIHFGCPSRQLPSHLLIQEAVSFVSFLKIGGWIEMPFCATA